jgi:hypothetical protein
LATSALVVFVAACSSLPPADPSPQTPTTPTVAPAESSLDLTGLDACSIPSAAALMAAFVDPATATDDSTENAMGCIWRSLDNADSLQLVASTNYSLERITDALDAASPESARLTIRGLPAAREGPADGSICTIYTALSSTQLFSAQIGSRSDRPTLPCETAERFAGAVVDSLRARSR